MRQTLSLLLLFLLFLPLPGFSADFNGRSLSDWGNDLKSSSQSDRQRATEVLAHFGTDAVPLLLEALHDPDYKVRHSVTQSLVRIGPPALPKLKPMLDDADEDAALRAAEVIAKMGPAGVPVMVDLVKGGYTDSWRRMLTGLHGMTPQGRAVAVPELVGLLQDPDNEVRERAGMAMRQMGPDAQAAAPFLVQTLVRDPRMRGMAQSVLIHLGPQIVPILIESLKDPNPDVRQEVIKTLAALDKRQTSVALEVISKLCERDPEQKVRSEAWSALRRVSGRSLPQGQCQEERR